MSRFESGEQSQLWIATKRMVVDVAHGFHREAAGLLSTFVPAHPIGDNGEPAFAEEIVIGVGLPINVGVFVIAAQAADVGQTGRFDSGLWSLAINRHNLKGASVFLAEPCCDDWSD